MTRRLTGALQAAPATIPALATLVLFVVWATDQAGYPLTHWAPGGLIVLALLVIALSVIALSITEIPLPVRIALACFAAYTALSFLSILWAAVPGDAWEGANRTLLYLLVFGLFALWQQRGPTAAMLLCAWTGALIVIAAFVALHVDGANLATVFPGARLNYPTGYVNANAAQWLMAFWPALLLARSEHLHWGIRGLFAGGSVLLGDVALLSQSRGSLYSTPVILVLVFVLVPKRARTFAVLVPIALAIGLTVPAVLRVGSRLEKGENAHPALHSAVTAMFIAALLVALVVALAAAFESRRGVSASSARRIHRAVSVVAIVALVGVLVGGLVLSGNPVTRVRHQWATFKSGNEYAANGSGNRLTSGLGSARYDFYRVALDEFSSHPLLGIGSDNFSEAYLRHRRSEETPHYPHSVELRTLAQTGLMGALLALVGLCAALLAGWRAMAMSDPLGRTVAAAALGGFAYWAVHGSFDWFWEFAGLGAPAFALLGIACSLAPRRQKGILSATSASDDSPSSEVPGEPEQKGLPRTVRLKRLRWAFVVVGAMAVLTGAASFTAPWLSQRQVQSAARIWVRTPLAAYARLNSAAELNPLSDEAYVVAASIALRFGDVAHADHEFSLALKRTPGDAYATLERGAIASSRGNRSAALTLLQHAALLDPRDPLTQQALDEVRHGVSIEINELNRSILLKAKQLA